MPPVLRKLFSPQFARGERALGSALAVLIVLAMWSVLTESTGEHYVPALLALVTLGLILKAAHGYRLGILLARINHALEGVVSPDVLQKIRRDPENFSVTASDQLLTVLIVDFVGFSTIADQLAPAAMFHLLEDVLHGLASIVHAHGGIVDKTVGDGLIAFFGYDPIMGTVTPSHADQALACAIDLQHWLARRATERKTINHPTFAARVGMETGRVHVGNLGGRRRFELSVIGQAVNMAKRYEDACEVFRLLVGPNTYRLLSPNVKTQGFHPRQARVKHHKRFIEAYECDPFAKNPEILSAARECHRTSAVLLRNAERHLLPPGGQAIIVVDGSRVGEVADYSATGMQVKFETLYFANRVRFNFDLILTHEHREMRVQRCYATVRWGRPLTSGGYLHGLELDDGHPNLKELLVQLCSQPVRSPTGSKDAA